MVYGVDYQEYLILFAPHAFASECQYLWGAAFATVRWISTHFTATPEILPPLYSTLVHQFQMQFQVEPRAFTSDLMNHLHALYAQ